MNSIRLKHIQSTYDLPDYRVSQLRTAFFDQHLPGFDDVTTLSKALRQRLLEEESVLTVSVHKVFTSVQKNAVKALLRLKDEHLIETVLLNPKPGLWTCCISSQVGCLLGCTFCATGKMGFLRQLTSEEITDQVLFWRFYMAEHRPKDSLNNVVYMGMGEPFHNKNEVFDSIDELMNGDTFDLGARHLSVSTSGLVPVIYEFADRFKQVNLAISLHAPNDELRLKLMPVNKAYPLDKLMGAIDYYLNNTNRKIFIEYILLDGENDSASCADQLAELLGTIKKKHLVHVNLIVYNTTDSAHSQSSRETARAFKERLHKHRVKATIRKNLGRDINGACGQLALTDPGKRLTAKSMNAEILNNANVAAHVSSNEI